MDTRWTCYKAETKPKNSRDKTTKRSAMNLRITRMDIEALVDNELDPQTAARVSLAVEQDPRLRHTYQTLMAQKKLLNMWWHSQQQFH
jgi:hypothetical protein